MAKRPRKANFTAGETAVLLAEYGVEKDVLQSSFNSVITAQKKKGIWNTIAGKVSACGVAVRTAAEVRDKWRNLKTEVLKRKSSKKKTGGGPPSVDGPFDDLVLDILGTETAIILD